MKKYLLLILCITSLNAKFNIADFFKPTINTSIETNYCIENNNFEYLETMTVSLKSPRILLFFSSKQENGLFTEAMNKLKTSARSKYSDNIAFINTTKVERNNLTLLFPIWYTEEIIISSDIVKLGN